MCTYWGDETYIVSFGKGKLNERNHLVDIIIEVTGNYYKPHRNRTGHCGLDKQTSIYGKLQGCCE
jgi:hypothetical protein